MSVCIYDDVVRTEGMDREREEMMVAVYESADSVRDQDFRTEANTHQPLQSTGSACVKTRRSRAVLVCLVLLCFLLLTAVVGLSVYIYTNNTNYTRKREELLTRINNLTEARDELLTSINNLAEEKNELLTSITNLTQERDELLTRITNLTQERDELLTSITNLTQERDEVLTRITNLTQERDELLTSITNLKKVSDDLELSNQKLRNEIVDGWIYYQSSLYFFSSVKKSWTESRRYCTERGADLIIINNREEQDFVKKMSSADYVWIGLTDTDEEGRWKWVDGSELNNMFWCSTSREPNGGRKENCAVSHSFGWADYPCEVGFRWICEKSV